MDISPVITTYFHFIKAACAATHILPSPESHGFMLICKDFLYNKAVTCFS